MIQTGMMATDNDTRKPQVAEQGSIGIEQTGLEPSNGPAQKP